jgi:hypothetical protein
MYVPLQARDPFLGPQHDLHLLRHFLDLLPYQILGHTRSVWLQYYRPTTRMTVVSIPSVYLSAYCSDSWNSLRFPSTSSFDQRIQFLIICHSFLSECNDINQYIVFPQFLAQLDQILLRIFNGTSDKYDDSLSLILVFSMFECELSYLDSSL